MLRREKRAWTVIDQVRGRRGHIKTKCGLECALQSGWTRVRPLALLLGWRFLVADLEVASTHLFSCLGDSSTECRREVVKLP